MRRYRHLLLICLSFALIIGSNAYWVKALAFPTKIQSVEGDSVTTLLVPDWELMSFSSFPGISSSGSVKVDGQTRSWLKGQTPAQYLQLGDIDELKPSLLTLNAIFKGISQDYSLMSLADFILVGKQTVARLAAIVPGLGELRVKDVPVLKALFIAQGANNSLNLSVKAVAADALLGQLKLNQIDLSSFSLDSIPNLDQVELGQFDEYAQALISEVVGLKDLPLSAFPSPLTESGNVIARIDAVWGKAEKNRARTVSGSYNEGFEVPCQDSFGCPYIELDDLENTGRQERGSFEGKSWISGKYQKVSGGSGCLSGVNGGKEPTGRHPYGEAFKVSVEEPQESTDQVDTALYFRFSNWCGKTPYFVGPVPFLTYKVNNLIFLGKNQNSSPEVVKGTTGGTLAQSLDKPFAVERLARAIALMSETNYVDVSPVVSEGTISGRILGRYGFLSYAPMVVKAVGAIEGGTDWLAQLTRLREIPTEQMKHYFPPALQEELLLSVLNQKLAQAKSEIDPQTGERLTGERLVERIAQKYAFGDAVSLDGVATVDDTNIVQSFAEKVKDNYLNLQ